MWVFTERGFYSAVEKHGDKAEGMVTVRSRTKADLERLADLIDAKPYKQTGFSDYPWRLRCSKEEWAAALYAMAQEIDYPNFKDRVKQALGASRAAVYGRVWGVLLSLENWQSKGGYTYTQGSYTKAEDTDRKCRVCKQEIGQKHKDDCSIYPGYNVIPVDCTRLTKQRKGTTRKQTSKRRKKAGSR